jgi:uncharacterized protein
LKIASRQAAPDPSVEEFASISVRAIPRAARNSIDGWHGSFLKVHLQAPPVDGKANAALIVLLAETLGVSRKQIEITSGESSRTKRVRVHGLSAKQVNMRLGL